MTLSAVALRELKKCRALRVEAAGRAAPVAWARLDMAVRRLLVTLADVGDDVPALAARDWRQFAPDDQARIGSTARFLAAQLGQAGAALW